MLMHHRETAHTLLNIVHARISTKPSNRGIRHFLHWDARRLAVTLRPASSQEDATSGGGVALVVVVLAVLDVLDRHPPPLTATDVVTLVVVVTMLDVFGGGLVRPRLNRSSVCRAHRLTATNVVTLVVVVTMLDVLGWGRGILYDVLRILTAADVVALVVVVTVLHVLRGHGSGLNSCMLTTADVMPLVVVVTVLDILRRNINRSDRHVSGADVGSSIFRIRVLTATDVVTLVVVVRVVLNILDGGHPSNIRGSRSRVRVLTVANEKGSEDDVD
ncbi:hypothetical protein BD311DRAFT_753602 [Dichomitus squalens]|uniref:Uncharacterized protein n=1 Tax=Dichomitus squalens TaxID=114155 RepID=A0A4Q9MUT4_9APHY|nr:hypothetical protein BD311DRAFT_753602 [Dichomitus squalens]